MTTSMAVVLPDLALHFVPLSVMFADGLTLTTLL